MYKMYSKFVKLLLFLNYQSCPSGHKKSLWFLVIQYMKITFKIGAMMHFFIIYLKK